MSRKCLTMSIVVLGVVCVVGLTECEARGQAITVTVMQVRASNQGEPFVDAQLGALGKRLQKTYPYKRFTLINTQTRAGNIGGKVNFGLSGGMSLALGLTAFNAPVVSLNVVVTRGQAQVVNSNIRVSSGRPVILGFPLGADKLIVVITPSARR